MLYGGGYVLLAFLEQGLVQQHSWLTQQQLLDAVAIGQVRSGIVLSTATFIGYILGGAQGAAVATVGIFLPSFFYVALLAPVLFRLRKSTWIAAFLDFRQRLRGGADGGSYIPPGSRCLTNVALLGNRSGVLCGAVALEDQPGLDCLLAEGSQVFCWLHSAESDLCGEFN